MMVGRGIAIQRTGPNAQRIATVAQVVVDRAAGTLRVTHLWIAVDVGLIVNPDGLLNQIQDGALQGLSRTLNATGKRIREAPFTPDRIRALLT